MNYGKKSVKKKQKSLNAKSVKWGKKLGFTFVQVFLVFLISISVIGACAGIGVFRGILATAPDISNIDVTPTGFSTFVYDIEGHQIAKLVSTDSNRIPVSMDMIPENLEHAFVAVEDARFYVHSPADIVRVQWWLLEVWIGYMMPFVVYKIFNRKHKNLSIIAYSAIATLGEFLYFWVSIVATIILWKVNPAAYILSDLPYQAMGCAVTFICALPVAAIYKFATGELTFRKQLPLVTSV